MVRVAVVVLAAKAAMLYDAVILTVGALQSQAETDLYRACPQLFTIPAHFHNSIFAYLKNVSMGRIRNILGFR